MNTATIITAADPSLFDTKALVQDILSHEFEEASGIQTRTVWITPQLASRWLARNVVNRPLARGNVDAIMWDLTNDRWELTHQGIGFNLAGRLIDGQHRLHAIVESNTPALVRVSWNVGGEYDAPIDTNYVRRAAHVLGLTTMQVAVTNALVLLETGCSTRISPSRIRTTYDRFAEDIDWAIKACGGQRVTSPIMAAFAYARPVAPERIEQFVEQFVNFAADRPTSPVVALRHLVERPWAVRAMGRRVLILAVLRCLQAFTAGGDLKRVNASDAALKFFKDRRAEEARGAAE